MMDPLLIGASALGGIAAICVALNQIDDFVKRRSGRDQDRHIYPQPLEVKPATAFVSKHDFDAHTEYDKEQFEEIKDSIATLRQERKQDVGLLHKRMNGVSEQNAAQSAVQTLMNQRLVQMDGKLDRALERIKG